MKKEIDVFDRQKSHELRKIPFRLLSYSVYIYVFIFSINSQCSALFELLSLYLAKNRTKFSEHPWTEWERNTCTGPWHNLQRTERNLCAIWNEIESTFCSLVDSAHVSMHQKFVFSFCMPLKSDSQQSQYLSIFLSESCEIQTKAQIWTFSF